MSRGAHQIAFGFLFVNLKATAINYLSSNGAFTFNGQFSGLGNADFLLGTGRLPQHVDPASSLGQQMATEAAVLKSYNTGAFTPESPNDTCQSPWGSGY